MFLSVMASCAQAKTLNILSIQNLKNELACYFVLFSKFSITVLLFGQSFWTGQKIFSFSVFD